MQDRFDNHHNYRLPYAYKDEVLKDLKKMQENGIVEPSKSEW